MRPCRFVLHLGLITLLFVAAPGCGGPGEAPDVPPPAAIEAPATPPVPIRNATAPLPGVLAGGQPTKEQLAAAADAGYTAVVNLRAPGEGDFDERAVVESLGMAYFSIPVDGASGLTLANAEALDAALLEIGEGPAVVHCASGNRVGALFALRAAWVEGKDAAAAMEIGRAAGLTKMEPDVLRVLESGAGG